MVSSAHFQTRLSALCIRSNPETSIGFLSRRLINGASLLMHWRIVVSFLMLGVSGLGQVKFDNHPAVINDVLRDAHVSGSIVYSDVCKSRDSGIPVPPHVYSPRDVGSPVEILQQMFSGDPRMQVSQERNGIIRMVEKDVPTDILDVKIHHIAFDLPLSSDPDPDNGPDRALLIILGSPEVLSFRKDHNILPSFYRASANEGGALPAVSGELNDVTLYQALDYVLKTFPGYWVYENCTTEDGGRTVRFRFYWNGVRRKADKRGG